MLARYVNAGEVEAIQILKFDILILDKRIENINVNKRRNLETGPGDILRRP